MTNSETPLLLGIDTGGTFTDAALIDATSGAVVATAKSPTTHHDLLLGVAGAIDALLTDAPRSDGGREIGLGTGPVSGQIALVSVSTTLATNALVESTGSPACLVTLGFAETELRNAGILDGLAPGDDLLILPGGHDAHGGEQVPVDDVVAAACEAASAAGRHFDGYAIAAQFSVRNPAHEIAVADALRTQTGRPVTRSHALSARLGGPRRALTALLNARLVGLITGLIAAVDEAKAARSIDAPTMVVRGDGSLVAADFAADRPIETILSGPAASVVGAMHLADAPDSLVADIGGTTTDICVVRDGRPAIAGDGATVAGHRTMVEAVDMVTVGLGGDSEVVVGVLDQADADRPLRVGPQRAVPLGRLALAYPAPVESFLTLAETATTLSAPDLRMLVSAGESIAAVELDVREQAILDALADGPRPECDVVDSALKRRAVERLRGRGLIRVATVTPTDAAVQLGLIVEPAELVDGDASARALGAFARLQGGSGASVAGDGSELARAISDELVLGTAEVALRAALGSDGLGGVDPRSDPLISATLQARRGARQPSGTTRIDIGIDPPIVAIGASAPSFYPAVGQLVGTEVLTPTHGAVANAVGAAVAQVVVRSELTVTQPRKGQFRVHGVDPQTVATVEQALDHATVTLRTELSETVERAGGHNAEITTEWTQTVAVVGGREVFVEGVLTGEARAQPVAVAQREP